MAAGSFAGAMRDGTEQVEAVAGVAIDDFWSRDQVTAPELANLYSGRLWRIATRSGPEADSVGGRAALATE